MTIKAPSVYQPKQLGERTVLVAEVTKHGLVKFFRCGQLDQQSWLECFTISEQTFLMGYQPSEEPLKSVAQFYWALSRQLGLDAASWNLLKTVLPPHLQKLNPKEPDMAKPPVKKAADKTAAAKESKPTAAKPDAPKKEVPPKPLGSVKADTKKVTDAASAKLGKSTGKPTATPAPEKPAKVAKPASEPKAPPRVREVTIGESRKVSVSGRIQELLLNQAKSGLNDDEIFAKVKEEFGLDDSKRNYIAWNRSKLRGAGLLVKNAA